MQTGEGSMNTAAQPPSYNGLTAYTPGLSAERYFDPAHYARELEQIWYRQWIYAGRSAELPGARSFRRFALGDQQLMLLRDVDGSLRGFHNTCRHRGAALCREERGELASSQLVCPYHAWVYSLEGRLLRTSSKRLPDGFRLDEHSLYPVHVKEWNGFLFVTLAADPPPFGASFDQPLDRLDAWSPADLVVGHVLCKTMACNWKIFWENYNECLHCPGVHRELSLLVPLYGRALLEARDDPEWPAHATDADPRYRGGLRRGAATWSKDGQISAAPLPNVSAADAAQGAVYLTGLPSVFIVGHVDYMRVVRLLPLGPERTELRVEYLFTPEALRDPSFRLANIVEFTDRVMSEDAAVCELNQQGLRALPHARGVVMPEEYAIKQFHDWLAAQTRS
jgi:Rieske 2Fe-2S family protein